MNWFDRAARFTIKLDPQGLLRWMLPGLGEEWRFQGCAALQVCSEKSGGEAIWDNALEGWGVEESTFAKAMEARGEQRARREDIRRTLRLRFGPALTTEIQQKIQQQSDLAVLDRWFDAAVTAATIEEFGAQVR